MGLGEMRCARRIAYRGRAANIAAVLFVGLVALATLFPSPAKAWWNDEWSLRKKITIDASAT
jgi:biopolymer transport protein ExbB